MEIADGRIKDQWPCLLQHFADGFAARDFANSGVTGVVSEEHDGAREARCVPLRYSSMLSCPATGMTRFP